MTKNTLTPAARETIKASGLTLVEYRRFWGGDDSGNDWYGDSCGCSDDRCIGYHHEENERCGCLVPCIAQALEERARVQYREALQQLRLLNGPYVFNGFDLAEVASMRDELDAGLLHRVRWMRGFGGYSWEKIAEQLGVSRQAAWERFAKLIES